MRYITKHKEDIYMATKALNIKIDEDEIHDMKRVASVFNMSVTDLVKNAVREYISELKKDPFYRLTANVEEASDEESSEILDMLNSMSDDDLTITSSKQLHI
jgi:hypothetical protein